MSRDGLKKPTTHCPSPTPPPATTPLQSSTIPMLVLSRYVFDELPRRYSFHSPFCMGVKLDEYSVLRY
jgi:hypothetical protein